MKKYWSRKTAGILIKVGLATWLAFIAVTMFVLNRAYDCVKEAKVLCSERSLETYQVITGFSGPLTIIGFAILLLGLFMALTLRGR